MNKKYPTLPFSIRSFEDATGAKVGVKECVAHDLLTAYPVFVEKTGEYVAQFKCTIAILPRSTIVLAGDVPVAVERFETDKKVNDVEMINLLESDLWKKEDKKKTAPKKDEEQKQ